MKVRYLLDTNICIYILKQRPAEVVARFESLQVGEVVISLITHGELRFGAEKSHSSARVHESLDELLALMPVLPMSDQVAFEYGKIRADLQQRGCVIGANDLWIAAQALAEDLILVSNNIREFERVTALKLENWVTC
ncbi:MAG: type II toxin-antitoxin system VapC family toxin [Gammaproteobacteria bacterium]|nr:type II toxin-antitoxin system VapC family toxin [Gammaproteobacteria bacterium]